MNSRKYITEVRNLIEKDNLLEALKSLKLFFQHSPKLNEVLLQSARYHHLNRLINMDLVGFDEAEKAKGQIRESLLQLVDEIAEKDANPEFHQEIEHAAISISNSNNVIIGSTITSAGNVRIGDETIVNTESKTSRNIRIFLFILLPLLVIGATYLWYQNKLMQTPLQIKVLIEDLSQNTELPGPEGNLSLIHGGEVLVVKKGISTEAVFDNIPANFRKKDLRLTYKAKGFYSVDTTFHFNPSVNLKLQRDSTYAILQGYIYEEVEGGIEQLEGVRISIDCCSTFSGKNGKFRLLIPLEKQRMKQRLDFFRQGYKPKNSFEPLIHGEELRIYLEKKP